MKRITRAEIPVAIKAGLWYDDNNHGKAGVAAVAWYVYLVECADGTLYAGATTDPARREREHNAGTGAKYTRARRPVRLVFQEACADKSEALRREAALKRLPRAKKLALISKK